MYRSVTNWLDEIALRSAERSVKAVPGAIGRAMLAREMLMQSSSLGSEIALPTDLVFTSDRDFRFSSPAPSEWPENNIVRGKLFRCKQGDWRKTPTAILIHGWNAELGYRYQFPWLAWLLNRQCMNAATIELPLHAQRKPTAQLNFLSGDLVRMMNATRQALADVRTLGAWLVSQGNPCVGLWGFSLGAWLAGLMACHDTALHPVVLVTPVAKMERAIAELSFCKPIRSTCETTQIWPNHLNLVCYQPRIPKEQILLVEATHDLFAAPETVEEIWRHWGCPAIWRVAHGHISVLLSIRLMSAIAKWISEHCRTAEAA